MAEKLTEKEKQLMEIDSDKEEIEKQIKEPFFYYWDKEHYLKSFTDKGYPGGIGLKTKDGTQEKRLPFFKKSLKRARWYVPPLMIVLALLILVFSAWTIGIAGNFGDLIKKIFTVFEYQTKTHEIATWHGPFYSISMIAFCESMWFLFYYGCEFIFYFPYRRKEMHRKTAIDLQRMNVEANRKKYGTLSYRDILPNLGPGKMFNVTVLDDPKTLHDNMGWIIKCGVTKDPDEISLAKKGLLSKRMWEERPDDIINKVIAGFSKAGGIPDKDYVFYVVTNSIDKLHCYSEGDTGSGKTEAFASPESIFVLRHVSHPSVLFTCKGGDQESTVNQALCLDIPVHQIQLNKPGNSSAFNPLFLPYLYHKLKRQLKYSIKPVPMNISPFDWENQYDVEVRQKDSRFITVLEDISTKEDLLEQLSNFTNDKNIASLMVNWQDDSVTLQDMIKVYKSWENKKWIVVDIKKHFLMTDKFSYWTPSKKKNTTLWYRCGNWIFETLSEFETNKDRLYSMVESEFQGSIESVITNVMNEEKNVSTDAFWNNQVRLFLKMFIGTFFDLVEMGDFSNNQITMSDAYFNLPTLCTWLNNYCESAAKMKELADNYAGIIPTIEKMKSNMVFPDQTFQSITGSVNAITQYYSATSELLPIICRNDFNPLDFGLQQMLLCITTNNDETAKANVLLKDVAGQILKACDFICNNYGGKSTMPRPVRVVADEAGSGSPIPWGNVNAIATKGRSQKILEGLYYQTTSQIKTQYPKQQGAEEILFGNLALKRCIKASAEDSLNKWSSILGKGFATTLTDMDKHDRLAGPNQENPYFPAEYIRNKPMWNTLIKIGEMKTIDISSCPIFPTFFKKQLAEEAQKHINKEYKQRVTTSTNFWDNNYINLAEALSYLDASVKSNYNFVIIFNQLESEFITNDDGETVEMPLPFAVRFSPESQLQTFTSTLENFSLWEKKYNEHQAMTYADTLPAETQVVQETEQPQDVPKNEYEEVEVEEDGNTDDLTDEPEGE